MFYFYLLHSFYFNQDVLLENLSGEEFERECLNRKLFQNLGTLMDFNEVVSTKHCFIRID